MSKHGNSQLTEQLLTNTDSRNTLSLSYWQRFVAMLIYTRNAMNKYCSDPVWRAIFIINFALAMLLSSSHIRIETAGQENCLSEGGLAKTPGFWTLIGSVILGILGDQVLYRKVKSETREKIISNGFTTFDYFETIFFSLSLITAFVRNQALAKTLKVIISIITSRPVFLILHQHLKIRHRNYRDFCHHIKTDGVVFKMLEATRHLNEGMDLASFLGVFTYHVINLCYDAEHPENYAASKYVVAGVASIALIMGAMISYYEKPGKLTMFRAKKAGKLGMLAEMFCTNVAACEHPRQVAIYTGFNKGGYRYPLGFSFLAVAIAALTAKYTREPHEIWDKLNKNQQYNDSQVLSTIKTWTAKAMIQYQQSNTDYQGASNV